MYIRHNYLVGHFDVVVEGPLIGANASVQGVPTIAAARACADAIAAAYGWTVATDAEETAPMAAE